MDCRIAAWPIAHKRELQMIKYPGAYNNKTAKAKTAWVVNANAAASFQQGLAYHQLGDLRQAAHYYQQALTSQPSHFDSLHMLGVIHYQQHQFDASVGFIKKAISIHQDFGAAYSNLGNALLAMGLHEVVELALQRLRGDHVGGDHVLLDAPRPVRCLWIHR